jgi:hypothetical protein
MAGDEQNKQPDVAAPGQSGSGGSQIAPFESKPPAHQQIANFLAQTWLPLLLIISLIVVAAIFHNDLAAPSVPRACIVFALAAAALYGANEVFFVPGRSLTDPLNVRFVIAFDIVIFIIVGLAATILACNHWEPSLLLAGSCLLIGGFFGLLFGYPQGVAQQATTPPAATPPTQGAGVPMPQATPPTQATGTPPTHEKNLLADSAATLGKVITGFTLAKLGQFSVHYSALCHTIGPSLGVPSSGAQATGTDQVVAGLIIAYFLATGFFSGLLLPPYFMSGQI